MRARIDGDFNRARRTVWAMPLRLALGVAAVVAAQLAPEPWQSAAWVLLAGVIGIVFPGAALDRQLAYGSGWHRGRRVAFDALAECARRGMTIDDWIDGEMERTGGAL